MARFMPSTPSPAPILFVPPEDMGSLEGRRYASRAEEAVRDEIRLRYAWNACYQGDAYFEAKDLERSSKAYEEALRNPQLKDHPVLLLSLGRNFALKGDAARGRSMLERAKERNPDNPLAYQYLFNLSYMQKDMAGAGRILDEALSRFPDNSYFLSMKDALARQGGMPAAPPASHPERTEIP
jgi:tetratricopeptide (TPR) repeat protein